MILRIVSTFAYRSASAFLHVAAAGIAALTLLSLLLCRVALAADDAATPPKPAPSDTEAALKSESSDTAQPSKYPSSGGDFTGDKLVLKSNVYGFTWLKDKSTGWIAMRGTILRVTRDETSEKGDLLVIVETVPCVVKAVKADKESLKAERDTFHIGVGGLVDCPKDADVIGKLVKADEVYKIPKQELENYGYYRSGWVYGALLVPYKYYFHDKSFASSATVGPYLGYSMGGLGIDTSLVASVGLSSLSVANPNGSGDTSTIQGFSAAIGLIGGINKNKNPLRFGLVIGRDWAGSNSAVPYKHEGKTWAAVQIGFSFSEK